MTSGSDIVSREAKNPFIFYALLIFLPILVYQNTLHNGFVWDDHLLIENNSAIQKIEYLPRYFTQDVTKLSENKFPSNTNYYRPLFWVTLLFDYTFWRENPLGYHLTSVLFHLLSCLALYSLLNHILETRTAFIGALLFAVHPVHSEAVAAIFNRSDTFSFASFVMALLFYIKAARANSGRAAFAIFSALFLMLSLLMKEMAYVFPGIILIYDLVFLDRDQNNFSNRFARYLPYAAVFLVYFYAKSHTIEHLAPNLRYWGGDLRSHWLTLPKLFVHFLRILIWPFHLSPCHYEITTHSTFHDFGVWMSIGILIIFIPVFKSAYDLSKPVFFFLSWCLVTYLPISQVIPLGMLVGDRYAYFSSAGFCALAAIGIVWLENKFKQKRITFWITVIFVSVYAAAAFGQNRLWKDDLILWKSAKERYPKDAIARLNYGRALFQKKMFDESLLEFDAVCNSVNVTETYCATAHSLKSIIYSARNEMDRAIRECLEGIALKPTDTDLQHELQRNLGIFFIRKEDDQNAIRQFLVLLNSDPNDFESYMILASVYARRNDNKSLAVILERALKIRPNDTVALYNLAVAQSKIGNFSRSMELYHHLLAINPDDARARKNLTELTQQRK